MSTFLELSSIKTPDFFYTFTVNFTFAPVVLHPVQNGVVNIQKYADSKQHTKQTFNPILLALKLTKLTLQINEKNLLWRSLWRTY